MWMERRRKMGEMVNQAGREERVERGIGSAIVEDSGEGEGWAAVSKWIGSTISMDKIDGPGKKDGGPDSPEIALLNPIFELSRKVTYVHKACDGEFYKKNDRFIEKELGKKRNRERFSTILKICSEKIDFQLDHQDCDCKNCYALFEHPLGHRDCPMIKKRVSFAKEVAPTGSVPTEALLLEFEKGLLGQLDLQEFLEEQKNQKQEEKVKFLEKEVAKLKKALDG
ncbi:hypothetical protein L5515_007904 [Caenorhabditis briggsae]|uniref:Uncharacterized protein n=1 Tax=Caenorhabditis briggsae TaxID=6238 RepID=A0AAE9F5X2_CAEBR|nr:hypothetical protein L5515_007904 [Caenorhabditis briggsae]